MPHCPRPRRPRTRKNKIEAPTEIKTGTKTEIGGRDLATGTAIVAHAAEIVTAAAGVCISARVPCLDWKNRKSIRDGVKVGGGRQAVRGAGQRAERMRE